MKNFKSIAMGFVAGAMCMVSVTAFASNYQSVSALLYHDIFFTFDGVKTASPSDQPVLNYNGYTYVPIRYVAETLNATVEWDPATKYIDIVTDKKTYIKEVEVEVEKIVYVTEDSEDAPNTYSTLPVSSKKNDVKVEITGVSTDEILKTTKIFVEVENDSTAGVQLVPSSAELIVDGEEVSTTSMINYWDTKWETSYIAKDSERDGYLVFNYIDDDSTNMELSVTVRDIYGSEDVYTYYFTK